MCVISGSLLEEQTGTTSNFSAATCAHLKGCRVETSILYVITHLMEASTNNRVANTNVSFFYWACLSCLLVVLAWIVSFFYVFFGFFLVFFVCLIVSCFTTARKLHRDPETASFRKQKYTEKFDVSFGQF